MAHGIATTVEESEVRSVEAWREQALKYSRFAGHLDALLDKVVSGAITFANLYAFAKSEGRQVCDKDCFVCRLEREKIKLEEKVSWLMREKVPASVTPAASSEALKAAEARAVTAEAAFEELQQRLKERDNTICWNVHCAHQARALDSQYAHDSNEWLVRDVGIELLASRELGVKPEVTVNRIDMILKGLTLGEIAADDLEDSDDGGSE